jgi:hypothetical protein
MQFLNEGRTSTKIDDLLGPVSDISHSEVCYSRPECFAVMPGTARTLAERTSRDEHAPEMRSCLHGNNARALQGRDKHGSGHTRQTCAVP